VQGFFHWFQWQQCSCPWPQTRVKVKSRNLEINLWPWCCHSYVSILGFNQHKVVYWGQ